MLLFALNVAIFSYYAGFTLYFAINDEKLIKESRNAIIYNNIFIINCRAVSLLEIKYRKMWHFRHTKFKTCCNI